MSRRLVAALASATFVFGCAHRASGPDPSPQFPLAWWDSEFPRSAQCEIILRPASSVDASARTGRLVVRVRAAGGAPQDSLGLLTGVRFGLAPAGASNPADSGRALGTPDGIWMSDALPPGQYSLVGRRIGFERRVVLVGIRAGATDTVELHLFPSGGQPRRGYNCWPRGFRRPRESACYTVAPRLLEYYMEVVERYRRQAAEHMKLDPAGFTGPVRVVTEERVCERAAKAFPPVRARDGRRIPRRVLVLEVGPNGYFVEDPAEPIRIGEWHGYHFFSKDFASMMGVAG